MDNFVLDKLNIQVEFDHIWSCDSRIRDMIVSACCVSALASSADVHSQPRLKWSALDAGRQQRLDVLAGVRPGFRKVLDKGLRPYGLRQMMLSTNGRKCSYSHAVAEQFTVVAGLSRLCSFATAYALVLSSYFQAICQNLDKKASLVVYSS